MKNITATGFFIKNKKILLEKRRKDEDNYAGLWAAPGGHKKPLEFPKRALKREMKEELNVDIKSAAYLGMFKDTDPTSKKLYHHHFFLVKEWKGRIKTTTEQAGIRWVALGRIKNLKNMNKVDIKVLKKAKLI